MDDLSAPLRTMKRIIILLLALMPIVASAQSKEDIKAQRKAERLAKKEQLAEMRRIEDSIARAEAERQRIAHEIEKSREGSTALICITIFEEESEVLALIVNNMKRYGAIPASIDKDFFIIKTEPNMVGSATYSLTYSIYKDKGKVCLRASGNAYKDFSVGSGLIRSSTSMVVPVEYGGSAESLFDVAWSEMELYLNGIPHTDILYIKE